MVAVLKLIAGIIFAVLSLAWVPGDHRKHQRNPKVGGSLYVCIGTYIYIYTCITLRVEVPTFPMRYMDYSPFKVLKGYLVFHEDSRSTWSWRVWGSR